MIKKNLKLKLIFLYIINTVNSNEFNFKDSATPLHRETLTEERQKQLSQEFDYIAFIYKSYNDPILTKERQKQLFQNFVNSLGKKTLTEEKMITSIGEFIKKTELNSIKEIYFILNIINNKCQLNNIFSKTQQQKFIEILIKKINKIFSNNLLSDFLPDMCYLDLCDIPLKEHYKIYIVINLDILTSLFNIKSVEITNSDLYMDNLVVFIQEKLSEQNEEEDLLNSLNLENLDSYADIFKIFFSDPIYGYSKEYNLKNQDIKMTFQEYIQNLIEKIEKIDTLLQDKEGMLQNHERRLKDRLLTKFSTQTPILTSYTKFNIILQQDKKKFINIDENQIVNIMKMLGILESIILLLRHDNDFLQKLNDFSITHNFSTAQRQIAEEKLVELMIKKEISKAVTTHNLINNFNKKEKAK